MPENFQLIFGPEVVRGVGQVRWKDPRAVHVPWHFYGRFTRHVQSFCWRLGAREVARTTLRNDPDELWRVLPGRRKF